MKLPNGKHEQRLGGAGATASGDSGDVAERRSATSAKGGVLLTGATGFVGMALLARYLERTDRRIYVLLRGNGERELFNRVRYALAVLFGEKDAHAERVVAVRGDITRPGLGLGRRRDAIAEDVCEIVHSAASVSFELDAEDSRAINVAGTKRIVKLAERCEARGGLRRLTYISTAFIAGDHAGLFSEDDLDVGQSFRNGYEQSKLEAERVVARSRARLPVTVLRPSIVVGERDTGWTTSFNGLYWPLRAFARGSYRALPGRHETPVDVVPVDYVADAALVLGGLREAEGATFHLTAGACASSVGELVKLAGAFFGLPAPRLIDPTLYQRFVHPLLLRATRDERRRRALRRSMIYYPYFATRVRFDDRRARAALNASDVRPTPLHTYFDQLVDYALAAEWGRRQISRGQASRVSRRQYTERSAARSSARAQLVPAL